MHSFGECLSVKEKKLNHKLLLFFHRQFVFGKVKIIFKGENFLLLYVKTFIPNFEQIFLTMTTTTRITPRIMYPVKNRLRAFLSMRVMTDVCRVYWNSPKKLNLELIIEPTNNVMKHTKRPCRAYQLENLESETSRFALLTGAHYIKQPGVRYAVCILSRRNQAITSALKGCLQK